MAERPGKARVTTGRSPRSALPNPVAADHTHSAELEPVLSLPALALAFLLFGIVAVSIPAWVLSLARCGDSPAVMEQTHSDCFLY